MKSRLLHIAAVAVLTAFAFLPLSSAGESHEQAGTSASQVYSIAVIPFANYSGESRAEEIFMPMVQDMISRNGLRIIAPEKLRPTLRKHRIRAAGAIGPSDAAIIAEELDVDFLMLGSIDIFIDQSIPETGLSLRLLDPENMRIFWAASEAATGEDFTGLFGLGRINNIEKLAGKVIETSFKKFDKTFGEYILRRGSPNPSPTFALVTFDNLSGKKHAGEVVTNILLTELISRGNTVIEPGTVGDVFRSDNKATRGEVDLDIVSKLHNRLGVDFVVTGSVSRYVAGIAGVESSGPELEFSGRCLDSKNGRIIAAYDYSRRGSNSAALLNPGSCHSIGRLSKKAVSDFLKKLDKDIN